MQMRDPSMAEAEAASAIGADDLADVVLLEQYTSRRDQDAFAALVRRYGPLVLSVCRRVLHHEQDAEDAFQAVFCVLARKAGSISKRSSVGAWLHAVAYRLALKALAGRRRRPTSGTNLPDVPGAEDSPEWVWRELRPVLDEEVNRLPDKCRSAFVLCYVAGMTNDQAAVQLGCPLGTVLSRLARARERLRDRLTRRGLALSAGALAATLGSRTAAEAVQPGLAQAAIQVGVRYAAGQPVATGVASLADAFLKAMLWARLTKAVGVVSIGGMAAAVFLWLLSRGGGPAPSPPTDLQQLQGSWQVLAVEKFGLAPEENPRLRLVFTDNQWTMVVAGISVPHGPFVLYPSQEPKTIDFTMQNGKILRAIYHLEGDTLQLCLDYDMAETGGKRPTAFRPEPGGAFWTLRREPPGPNRP
jgi:RNA polymerase sigma factor (sigma-70 family)